MKKFPLHLLLLSVLFLSSCKKDDVDTTSREEVKQAIADLNLTSVSWAVVKNDQLLWADAVGESNGAAGQNASPEIRYLVASVSKTITATAIMQLHDQGLINIDDDINLYLPFSVRNPDYPLDEITIRMLLAHTSSISDNHQNTLDLYCYDTDCGGTLRDFFEAVFVPGGAYFSADNFSLAAPGEAEDYSNLGSALLGLLVEEISGQPFDDYCKQNIFTPLGMTKTEWRLSATPLSELAVPNSADIPSGSTHYTFPDYPNGGLKTTPEDLSRFLRMFMQGGTFNGTTLLQPATVAMMKTKQFGSADMCLSFYYEVFDQNTLLGHSGGEMGVTTEMFFDTDTNVGVIVFNNDDDANLADVVAMLMEYGESH